MIHILSENWQTFLTGFENTILCSVIALFFSLIIGSIFAILQTVPSKLVRTIANIYIEIFRNIPLLVITMVFYVVVPQFFIKLSGFTAGTIGLTLYTSAFIAEMRYIILPQAFKLVIPPLGNQFINLIKNSSVLAFVAGFDLMYQGDVIASASFETINTYLVVGVFYLILTLPLSYYMRYLEKKLA